MINMSLDDRSDRIRHDSSVPVATQVARDIEADIRAGRLAPDTRLPSEVDLSQQYGVARMTVRRAVAQLRDKGLVVTVHGRGSFVAPLAGTTRTMRDTLGWGGRKSSPVILVTSDQENPAPSLSRSVDSPTARTAVRNDKLGMSMIRDSVTA